MDLLFPYDQGFAFVEHLYDQNGFTTIDAAYLTPPLSTEQIMHPERYPADLPQTVELKNLESLLNGNWKLLNQNVMGEWSIYLILSQSYREDYRLTEVQAGQASEGWGGDSYAIYLNEATDEVIFVLDTVWDTLQDADEFMDALVQYADSRWDASPSQIVGQPTWAGQNGTIVIYQNGERILWLITPSEKLAETVFEALQ
jgi:hypothetical protein